MKFILNVNDVKYLLTPEQVNTIVTTLADAAILEKVYMGTSVPEADRFKEIICTPPLDKINLGVMDDTKYESLGLITKLHIESLRK